MGGSWEPQYHGSGETDARAGAFGTTPGGPSSWSAGDPDAPFVAEPLGAGWEPVGAAVPGDGHWWGTAALRPRRSPVLGVMVVLLVLAVAAIVAVPFVVRTSPAGAVDAALTSTFDDGTVQTAFTFTESVAGQQFQLTGTARIDTTTRQLALTVDVVAGPEKATVHLVASGTAVYFSAPGLIDLPTGRQWVGLTEAKLHAAGGLPGTSLTLPTLAPSTSGGSPFSVLEQAGAKVTTLGPSSVGGVAVHGYHIVVTPTVLGSLLAEYGMPASQTQQLRAKGISTVDLTVDVGDTGLVRQLQGSTQVSSGGQTAALSASAQFSGYGQPVTVTIPPPTQTATFFAVIGSLDQSPAAQLLSAA